MEFADKAAEDFYRELVNEYGYIHVNTGGKKIIVEDLMAVRNSIKDIIKKEKGNGCGEV